MCTLYQGKPDATISFTDNDFLVITSGKMNPQIAFIWLGEQKNMPLLFHSGSGYLGIGSFLLMSSVAVQRSY